MQRIVEIPSGSVRLEAILLTPPQPRGIVVLALGSGSDRRTPRSAAVAATLGDAGLGTLLLDLLTADEDVAYTTRFDIGLLTTRLAAAVKRVEALPDAAGRATGLLGTGTGAAAALQVAAALRAEIGAVVSCGGRPDLAGRKALALVKAPTLLVVGGDDQAALPAHERALDILRCETALFVVPGATSRFEESGTLGQVASRAAEWFTRHLGAPSGGSRAAG
ncbi:MAG: alpha/beta hydrolase [Burkholderiales bacterium]|nr:alpha/beta hydrolase [Burkholderiales bacterium]